MGAPLTIALKLPASTGLLWHVPISCHAIGRAQLQGLNFDCGRTCRYGTAHSHKCTGQQPFLAALSPVMCVTYPLFRRRIVAGAKSVPTENTLPVSQGWGDATETDWTADPTE